MKYHIWTEGCQMNVADSQRVASALEHLGYQYTARTEEADVIVLNTCVVRQSAEDKAYGRLSSLQPLKKQRPDLVINLMGCLVGVKNGDRLRQRFPTWTFSLPFGPQPLLAYLGQGRGASWKRAKPASVLPGWMATWCCGLRTRPAGFGPHPGGVWLFARLHLLHHPLPPRRGTQPAAAGGAG